MSDDKAAHLRINDQAIEPSNARELLGMMKEWRSGRATTNLLQALQDGYVTVFGTVVGSAMLIATIANTNRNVAECTTGTCLTSRAVLPAALVALLVAAALGVARVFGPVLASAAEGFWLFDAPIRRTRILTTRLVQIIVIALLVGLGAGALLATLIGTSVTGIVVWSLAAGLSCAAVMAFAAAEQGAERTRFVKLAQALASLVALAAMLLVIGIAAGWLHLGLQSDRTLLLGIVVLAAAVVVLVMSVTLAVVRINMIRRARLVSGGALVSGMQGAMFALDFGLMRDILVEREAVARGRVNPVLGRGQGASALIWRDVHRLMRTPRPLLGVAVSAVMPYAFASLGLSVLNPTLSGLVLCAVLVPTLGGLRVLTRTPGLARMLPMSTAQIRTAAIAVTAFLAVLWAAAITPAFMGFGSDAEAHTPTKAVLLAVITAAAGLMGAMRWVTAGQVNYQAPMMATAAGAMPFHLVLNLFRGIDMVALITVPLLFGLPEWVSLVMAFFVFIGLRGTFNMEELQNQKARQDEIVRREDDKRAQRKKIKVKR